MKKPKPSLDYHEGLSLNQVHIVLKELGYDEKEFNEFLYGQTCPMVPRYDPAGNICLEVGVYEHDLFRWIGYKRSGVPCLFD